MLQNVIGPLAKEQNVYVAHVTVLLPHTMTKQVKYAGFSLIYGAHGIEPSSTRGVFCG